jgi:S-adenosylmethionine hydrolase
MNSSTFLHLITDYGTGDLAFAEVIQRLKFYLPNSYILPTSVPAFSTIATGFVIAQLALNEAPENLFIYSNTAPRKDDKKKRTNNAGEKLSFAKLDNGIEIVAVNAQYAFSFVKPHIKSFHLITIPNHGSQFRSRDFYPEAVAGIIQGKYDKYLGDSIDIATIPEIPTNKIVYIDGYGNIKTTIRSSQVPYSPGEKIRITIDNHVRTAVYSDGIFAVKYGDLVFAPGSSGGKDRFMEISLRGSSAKRLFFDPVVESDINFERFED